MRQKVGKDFGFPLCKKNGVSSSFGHNGMKLISWAPRKSTDFKSTYPKDLRKRFQIVHDMLEFVVSSTDTLNLGDGTMQDLVDCYQAYPFEKLRYEHKIELDSFKLMTVMDEFDENGTPVERWLDGNLELLKQTFMMQEYHFEHYNTTDNEITWE